MSSPQSPILKCLAITILFSSCSLLEGLCVNGSQEIPEYTFKLAPKSTYIDINPETSAAPKDLIKISSKPRHASDSDCEITDYKNTSGQFDIVSICVFEGKIVEISATKIIKDDMESKYFWGALTTKVEENYPGYTSFYHNTSGGPSVAYNYFPDEVSWKKHFKSFCSSNSSQILYCSNFKRILHPHLREIFILKTKDDVTNEFLIVILFKLQGHSEAVEKKRKRINDGVKL